MEEVCPSCGGFAELVEITGWCRQCSEKVAPTCTRCTNTFNFTPGTGRKDLCHTCRREVWLEKHGDMLDELISEGNTFAQSAIKVAEIIRPSCLCCGDSLPRSGGNRGKFCRKRPECRKAWRRLRAYRENKGMSNEDALAQVLSLIAQERIIKELAA